MTPSEDADGDALVTMPAALVRQVRNALIGLDAHLIDALDKALQLDSAGDATKNRVQKAGGPRTRPRVLVTVNGGVAAYVCDEGVEVIVFDHDDYMENALRPGPVPGHFADLAVPIGVPVADETSDSFNLEAEIVGRLARGEHVVKRIVTMRWFTYEIDGEDVVVTDQKRAVIEQMAGAPLIEYTPAQYPLERGLGFDGRLLPEIQQRLKVASRA